MHTTIRFTWALAASALLSACNPAAGPASGTAASEPASQPAAPEAPASGLGVADAWIRSAPPGAPALAGYALLRNPGAAPLSVRPCHTEGFASTELHQTLHEDGMARMRAVEALEVAARGSVLLAPGGHHLMLTQPVAVPAVGEVVMVCLAVDGVEQAVPFEVRDATGAPAHEHDHAGPHAH